MSVDYTLVLWKPAGRTGLSGISPEPHAITPTCNSTNYPLQLKKNSGLNLFHVHGYHCIKFIHFNPSSLQPESK